MTQLAFELDEPPMSASYALYLVLFAWLMRVAARIYHRAYLAANRTRRNAQRLASKYGCSKDWRLWL
jgi:hypothetical protein